MENILFEGLFDVLKNELDIYSDVLKLCHEKTKVIIEGKVSELEVITRKEQTLVFQVADLEEMREKLVSKISQQSGKEVSLLTISALGELLPQDQAQKLKKMHQELLHILKDIKEVNSLNSKLIRNSLEYIDFSINILTGAEAPNNVYGNSGQTDVGKKRNFFDMKL